MTCCFKQAFLIFFKTKATRTSPSWIDKSEGIRKRFDYIPSRIESAKDLNTGTKIRDRSSRTGKRSGFFYFPRKNGRVSSYKTHLFFFGLIKKSGLNNRKFTKYETCANCTGFLFCTFHVIVYLQEITFTWNSLFESTIADILPNFC